VLDRIQVTAYERDVWFEFRSMHGCVIGILIEKKEGSLGD